MVVPCCPRSARSNVRCGIRRCSVVVPRERLRRPAGGPRTATSFGFDSAARLTMRRRPFLRRGLRTWCESTRRCRTAKLPCQFPPLGSSGRGQHRSAVHERLSSRLVRESIRLGRRFKVNWKRRTAPVATRMSGPSGHAKLSERGQGIQRTPVSTAGSRVPARAVFRTHRGN